MLINILKYIFLGFIQGFTEPIPVSSSGHLLIFQNLIKGNSNIDFGLLAIITNIGSLIAITWLYKNEIIDLFKGFFGYLKTKEKKYYNNYKYSTLVILATIPAGIMGIVVTKLGMFDFLEENIKFVGITLLITALFLFLIRNIKGKKEKNDITYKDAFIIGLFQVIALIPGISRSGATIVGGMTRNLKRETAFNFSFILYIPISVATTILGIKDLISSNLSFELLLCYIFSLITSTIVTYYATKWFRDIVKKGKLIYFVWYCLLIGTLVIIFL
mgnify:CR=1 FL=1